MSEMRYIKRKECALKQYFQVKSIYNWEKSY